MATITHCRFETRAAFLAAADAAGWPTGPDGDRAPPGGAVDEIGPLFDAPSIGPAGQPVPGVVIDGRWHVNVLWAGDADPALDGFVVEPETPARAFAVPPPPAPPAPPVPDSVAAWKGKAVLAGLGLLDAAEAAVAAAGGTTAIAWAGAAEWGRDSAMLAAMAGALGLTDEQVDGMFRSASAIQG